MTINTKVLVAQMVVLFLVFALALFLPAGTSAWLAGWCFLMLFFGFVVAVTLWLFRHNPELLQERMTGFKKPDQQGWDKVLMPVTGVLFFAWLVLMPLDAVRFHWSQVPVWFQVVGAIIPAVLVLPLFPDVSGKLVPVFCCPNSGRARTNSGVNWTIPLCASSDVFCLRPLGCGDAPFARVLVRSSGGTDPRGYGCETGGAGRTPVTAGTQRV